MLVCVSGVSNEEAADICECREGTIKSRVNRGKQQLLSILGYPDRHTAFDPRTGPAPNVTPRAHSALLMPASESHVLSVLIT